MSGNMKSERSKKEWEGLRRLVKNLRAQREEARQSGAQYGSFPGGFPGGMPGNFPGRMPGMAGMPGLNEILSDPEVLAATQNSEVMMAFQDVAQNLAKCQNIRASQRLLI